MRIKFSIQRRNWANKGSFQTGSYGIREMVGADRKPNSVLSRRIAAIIHLWMPITRHLLQPTRELGRAALKHSPIWSCTGWGLPSFSGRPENWCALTAPFHPLPSAAAVTAPGTPELPSAGGKRRSALCCTFLRVATTPRYGAPCPVVFGLSSGHRVSGDCPACSDRMKEHLIQRPLPIN